MWENASDIQTRSIFDEYHMPAEKMYFQGKADLNYIVNAWRKLDIKKFPMQKEIRKKILAEWKSRPELHGRHDNAEILKKHKDFIEMVASIKFSVDQRTNPNGMLALLMPGTMEVVWHTPAYAKLIPITDEFKEHMWNVRNAASMLILIIRLYANKLDVSKLPLPRPDGFSNIFSYQPEANGRTRFYTIRFDNEIYSSNSWSVGMEVDGELPELTQEDIDNILTNPFDAEHIRSIVDTTRFMFNGICFLWAEEITYTHQTSTIQKQLSSRDALRRLTDLVRFQDQVREIVHIDDLELGIILNPFNNNSRRARWQPYLNSLRFSGEIDPSSLAADDIYIQACKKPFVFNFLENNENLKEVAKRGFQSLAVAPLMYHDECIGLIEAASKRLHAFDFGTITRLMKISENIGMAINHVHEGQHERIMAVIKQTCTAIHPSVEWKFQEMANNYLKQIALDQIPTPEQIGFKQVYPLFGVSDIRSSSTKRNESIQADLEKQLGLAADVIQTAGKTHPRPVFKELAFRISQHQVAISEGLKSGDETKIYMFLRHVVESAFDELAALDADINEKVQAYRAQLDPEVGVIYQVRKSYDDSVTQINDTIGAYLDKQQEVAQEMIPHYFEKFKTDGVDHNIYIGDSILESGKCSDLDLRNLYLWQLMSMCGVVWLMRDLKPNLPTPLDTAHLLLVQKNPLNITFHMEENHFSVDGAYNARYEIVKKRIDKARIHGSSERLTQPEKIAIVYTQEREFQMYKEFITYLQAIGFLKKDYIDVLLEDLQGVHGLRAIRVTVADKPPADWNPKKPTTSLGL